MAGSDCVTLYIKDMVGAGYKKFETGCMLLLGLLLAAIIGVTILSFSQQEELSLLEAVNRRDPVRVEALLKRGADPQAKNGRAESPYDVARRMGDRRVVSIIERYLKPNR